jgi:hypothetical protein
MTADDATPPRLFGVTCSKCGAPEVGSGGILCAPCKTAIETTPLYPTQGRNGAA